MTMKLILLVIFAQLSKVQSESIELFTEDDFVGFIPYGTFFNGWIENPPSCFNFPEFAKQKLSSFISNDHCVILYDQEDCTGLSIKLDKDVASLTNLTGTVTQDNFDNRAVSLRACSETEGGPKVNADFFKRKNYEGSKYSYRDVCNCVTFPLDQTNMSSVDNHHNCLVPFTTAHCEAGEDNKNMFYVRAGKGSISGSINKIDFPIRSQIRSFRPCDLPTHCMKLSAEIFRYDVVEDKSHSSRRDMKYSSVSMGAHTLFYNNGSAKVIQEYCPKTTVTEEMSIGKIGFSHRVSSWSVVRRQSLELRMDLPFVKLRERIPLGMGEAYGNTCEDGQLEQSSEYEYTTSSEHSVKQMIEVPPCRAYEANATLNVVENFPMIYKAYFKLTGERNGIGRMTKEELREEVRFMTEYEYEYDEDQYTVVASGNSYIYASFGVESMVKGEGYRIPYCYH